MQFLPPYTWRVPRLLDLPFLKPLPFELKLLLTKLYASLRASKKTSTGYLEFSYFPFDSAQPLGPGALETLSAVSAQLLRQEIPAFVSDGTLLGLVRDGRLIPHDNDLDFVVLGIRHHKIIRNIMAKDGFKLASLSRLGSHIYHMSFFNESEHIVDFTLYEEAGSNFVSFRDSDNYFVIPKDLVAHLIWLEVGGAKVPVPKLSEDFLQLQYGAGWKTPAKQKDDWKASYYGTRRAFPGGTSVTFSQRTKILAQFSK